MNAKDLFVLTEEEETLSELALASLEPIRKIADDTVTLLHFSKEWVDKAWETFCNFTGLGIPEEPYKGIGGSSRGMVIFNEKLSSIDAALSLVLGATVSLVEIPILVWGTDDQKSYWLPLLASGKLKGCYIQTEPDKGSDVAGIKGKAAKVKYGDCEEWWIKKDACFITNGDIANMGLVLVRTASDPARPHWGLTMFIVDLNRAKKEGTYFFDRNEDKAGLHLSSTSAFKLERCVADSILGEENHGWEVAMSTLAGSRATAIPSQAIGVMCGARDKTKKYMGEREVFGILCEFVPIMRMGLRRIDAAIQASRLLTWRAAVMRDELGARDQRPWESEASQAKLFASEAAEWATSDAMQLMGGKGYLMKDGVGKFWHDARIIKIYEGTSHIQEIVIMREFLKRLGRKRLFWLARNRYNKISWLTRFIAADRYAISWPVSSPGWPTEEAEFQADAHRAAYFHCSELKKAYEKLICLRNVFLQELGRILEEFPFDPKKDKTFPSPYFGFAYAFSALEGAKLALWELAFLANHKDTAPASEEVARAILVLGLAEESVKLAQSYRELLSSFPSLKTEIEGKGKLRA